MPKEPCSKLPMRGYVGDTYGVLVKVLLGCISGFDNGSTDRAA